MATIAECWHVGVWNPLLAWLKCAQYVASFYVYDLKWCKNIKQMCNNNSYIWELNKFNSECFGFTGRVRYRGWWVLHVLWWVSAADLVQVRESSHRNALLESRSVPIYWASLCISLLLDLLQYWSSLVRQYSD